MAELAPRDDRRADLVNPRSNQLQSLNCSALQPAPSTHRDGPHRHDVAHVDAAQTERRSGPSECDRQTSRRTHRSAISSTTPRVRAAAEIRRGNRYQTIVMGPTRLTGTAPRAKRLAAKIDRKKVDSPTPPPTPTPTPNPQPQPEPQPNAQPAKAPSVADPTRPPELLKNCWNSYQALVPHSCHRHSAN